MNNELTRYQSFKGLPDYFLVSPIQLAQAGFYYTGVREEVICFSCKLKVGTWNTRETPLQVHRRLSPNCQFIRGQDTTNEPINIQETVISDSEKNEENERTDHFSTMACETTQTPSVSIQTLGGANGHITEESSPVLCVSGTRADYRTSTLGSRSSIKVNGHTELYPGITYEKPKHPDHAVKSVRLSSYAGWSHGVMDPVQMAEAGFFYTGIHDRVRCFFCGGGVKDWEKGDNPWIEHARWFPNCAFVRQSKGEEFINMCRMSNIDYLASYENPQIQVPPNWNLEGSGQQVEDQLIEDLNSSAAKLVMGMGYSQEGVETAIKSAREKYGAVELRAQYILEYLLDNSYVASGDNASNTSRNNDTMSSAKACATNKTSERQKEPEDIGEGNELNKEQQSLLEENRRLKESMTCKICMDKDACIVFLPCGHMVSCIECAHALKKCAVCRTLIQGTVRAFPA